MAIFIDKSKVGFLNLKQFSFLTYPSVPLFLCLHPLLLSQESILASLALLICIVLLPPSSVVKYWWPSHEWVHVQFPCPLPWWVHHTSLLLPPSWFCSTYSFLPSILTATTTSLISLSQLFSQMPLARTLSPLDLVKFSSAFEVFQRLTCTCPRSIQFRGWWHTTIFVICDAPSWQISFTYSDLARYMSHTPLHYKKTSVSGEPTLTIPSLSPVSLSLVLNHLLSFCGFIWTVCRYISNRLN